MSEAEDRDAVHIYRSDNLAWLRNFQLSPGTRMTCLLCGEEVEVGVFRMDPETNEFIDQHDTTLSAFYHCGMGHWIDCPALRQHDDR